ncbi:Protein of unknown function [Pseudarcicella hirudinis]|uniref:DUF4230 domain-containing protein n=1 Tax=Pseudarcicella hirudinis TaxID=1079859 RepID=A0A1I5NP58_9BACT|nr:DUF4230 domain-containing protein [Pseudarcicella hirudinis]SFP23605.1 Protein of unknown function [Pseudarcicella hirudinis]
MLKTVIRLLPILFIIVSAIWIWEKFKDFKNPFAGDDLEVTHHLVIQKITAMGKLELVNYRFKDVVESRIHKQFLPDAKAILIVEGEAIGCLDLTKVSMADLSTSHDTLVVHLPDPEICTYKIDHSKSKVYDTQFALLEEAKLVDQAFKQAETQIQQSAYEAGIVEQTKENADKILKPFLEEVSGKKILLRYQLQTTKRILK